MWSQEKGSGQPAPPSASASASVGSGTIPKAEILEWVPTFAVWSVVVFFGGGVLLTVAALRKNATWQLAAALGEKLQNAAPPTSAPPVGGSVGGLPPPAAPSQPPNSSSSSRLIAFFGTLALLAMFIGLGLYLLWALFNNRTAEAKEGMQSVGSYMLYGSSLFAPYAFNQIKEALKAN